MSEEWIAPLASDCSVDHGRCQSFGPGHNMHVIHASHVGRTPWGWRAAVLTAVRPDGTLDIRYDRSVTVALWHHEDLTRLLRVGDHVRLHEQYDTLRCRAGLINVAVRGGLGPVETPRDPDAWTDRMTGGVTELATGRGVPLDPLDADEAWSTRADRNPAQTLFLLPQVTSDMPTRQPVRGIQPRRGCGGQQTATTSVWFTSFMRISPYGEIRIVRGQQRVGPVAQEATWPSLATG